MNEIKIDCQLVSECWNTNNNNKCKEIEQIIKTNPKTKQQEESQKKIKENIYIETYVSKKNIFKGEQVEIAYKLFYRIN